MTAIRALAADLRAAGFTVDGLERLWGAEAGAALHRGHRLPALRALERRDGALATLARVFVLGLPAHPDDFEAALPSLGLAGAVQLGLLSAEGAPLLDLRPYQLVDGHGVTHWWIASDLGELALGHAIPEDHVLGVGAASNTLSGLMITRPAGTVLDLGTGCGIQALHAARFAERVVATDLSWRAVELARLNAELNGVDSIELRHGSLFEPVAGERFDRIISNPPFVITPRRPGVPAYEYRDGGMVGDALVETVLRGLAGHLNPGGIAQLLGNWEYRAQDGLDRVATWLEGSGLDVWVIERERLSVSEYAETWIRDGGTRTGPQFDALYRAWLDDFEARGVREVGFGYLTLRRPGRSRPLLHRLERLEGVLGGALGEQVASSLEAHEWLAERDDAALAEAVLAVAGDVTEERHHWPGSADPTVLRLRQGSGFARTVEAGTALAAVVGACDGSLPLGVICDAVAELLEADAAALRAELLPQLRELVFTGMLQPAR